MISHNNVTWLNFDSSNIVKYFEVTVIIYTPWDYILHICAWNNDCWLCAVCKQFENVNREFCIFALNSGEIRSTRGIPAHIMINQFQQV